MDSVFIYLAIALVVLVVPATVYFIFEARKSKELYVQSRSLADEVLERASSAQASVDTAQDALVSAQREIFKLRAQNDASFKLIKDQRLQIDNLSEFLKDSNIKVADLQTLLAESEAKIASTVKKPRIRKKKVVPAVEDDTDV